MLLNLATIVPGGPLKYVTRPILGALTRYVLGDQIANWLKIPRYPLWATVFQAGWEPFIRAREGLPELDRAPGGGKPLSRVFGGRPRLAARAPGVVKQFYWMFDELLRLAALLVLSGANFPISIEIPTGNNPNYPDD